jgi:hypothetical protein
MVASIHHVLGGTMTNAASVQLNPKQFGYAQQIIGVVRKRGLPKQVAVIAIEVALAESGLRMYANGNNPTSLKLPHDAVGFDHGSVGLFQQQVGGAVNSTANWGTTKQLMDPAISCKKFLNALGDKWHGATNWAAAQNTQRSAFDGTPRPANHFSSMFGGNYHDQDDHAAHIVNAFWGGPPVGDPPPSTHHKYWVDTFSRAPVYPSLDAAEPTGFLYKGRNYVFGKRTGPTVQTDQGHNHWWLKTVPDEGAGQWVSAYYLTHWGNDEAKDNDGHVIPDC